MKKISSNNPEFELNDNELIVYDHPKYFKIPFKEMVYADIYPSFRSLALGISLKENSIDGSSLNKIRSWSLNIPEGTKMVFLDTEFALIKPNKLKELVNERIKHQKENT